MLIALILPFILRRSRSTRDRLPSASARLPPARCWMATTMAKKLVSGTGTRSGSLATASASVTPSAWVSEMRAELGLDRLGGLGGDDLDAIVERQAGLDAADDDVHGVGELVEELVHAALAQEIHHPARQAEKAGDADGRGET